MRRNRSNDWGSSSVYAIEPSNLTFAIKALEVVVNEQATVVMVDHDQFGPRMKEPSAVPAVGSVKMRDALFTELRSAARLFAGGDLSEMSPLYARACEDRLDIPAAHVRTCAAELDAHERQRPMRSRNLEFYG